LVKLVSSTGNARRYFCVEMIDMGSPQHLTIPTPSFTTLTSRPQILHSSSFPTALAISVIAPFPPSSLVARSIYSHTVGTGIFGCALIAPNAQEFAKDRDGSSACGSSGHAAALEGGVHVTREIDQARFAVSYGDYSAWRFFFA